MRARIAWLVVLSGIAAQSFAADEAFFHAAARSGNAEVALGRLAVAKGSTDRIKAFGRQMVEEHGAANGRLQAAGAKSGVRLPTDLTPDAQATQNKLESLSGSAFDQAYAESQSRAHSRTVELLEKQIASGTDAAAKAWAVDALPMVKRHAELLGGSDAMPGQHEVEHATRTSGPEDARKPDVGR